MYKKNSQDIHEQDFQQHNELVCKNYQRPSPQYSAMPTKFDTLVYVGATTFNQKPNNNFNHSESSPFRVVAPGKK